MTRKHISLILAIAAMGLSAAAQDVYVTAIDGSKITAEIENAQGKSVADVLTRTFYMPTGESTTCSGFTLDGNGRIVADLDLKEGDYFYRVEVTFADGTTAMSDCYNAALTQTAVWLSDLTPTTVTGNPVHNDVCANGAPILIDGVTYPKGISAQAVSAVEYVLPRTFDYVQFVMGLQDCRADGTNSVGFARIINSVNGSETNWKANLYAKTNPSRGNSVCKFVARYPASGSMAITRFRFAANDANSNLTDDYCDLGAVRFYSAVPKRPQTVEFETAGGFIPDNAESVELKAVSSRGQQVTYRIVQGAELATLEGNVLTPHEGMRGVITVEANAAGSEVFEPASAQLTLRFNRAPTVQYLATYPLPGNEAHQTVYLYVDPKEKSVDELLLDIYSDPRDFTLQGNVSLSDIEATDATFIFRATTPRGSVHQLKYRFSGEEQTTVEPYGDGLHPFVYMTDLPGNTVVTGWGTATVNAPFSGSVGTRIENRNYTYAKGYGIHAANNQTGAYALTTADLSEFDRFVVDVGGQLISNTARGKLSFSLHDGTAMLASSGNMAWSEVVEWDMPISGRNAVKVTVGNGGDNNQNDVAAIGAPRFYYRESGKTPQYVSWPVPEEEVNYYKPFTLELNATASSGLPVFYRIAEGGEYAEIVDGSTLRFNKVLTGGDVVVEALQPGDKLYGPAEAAQCRFKVTDRLMVKRNERVEIEGDQDVDELVVYADALSSGQVVVRDGVANVKKLIIKYTFTPGEWNYISFPSSVNLDEISDLNEKGYRLNDGYTLQSYSSRKRSLTPTNSPWVEMTTPDVTAQVGYIFRLDDTMGTDPQEITFTITNVSLDLDKGLGTMHLTLDMSHSDPGSIQTVYVKPANVKGNILRVNVLFRPDDESLLPVNHARALEAMRVTFTPNRKGLRFTLPDQTPARVALFSADGSELVKAVRYVSPMVMDIADVPSGSYQLVVTYGEASTVRTIDL